jgi:hypothetical protein
MAGSVDLLFISALQQVFNGLCQTFQADRFAHVFIRTGFETTFPVAWHGQGGKGNDRRSCEA